MNSRTAFWAAALLLLLLTVASLVTSCGTWHGFGEDVERGGEKIQGK